MQAVSNSEVRRLVAMPDAVAALRDTFASLADTAGPVFDCPPRLVLGDGATLVMTARHRPSRTAVTKSLSVELTRTPAIVGTLAWLDPDRTEPLAIEAGAVTTIRTGGITGVATQALADRDADRMALVGAGAQAPDQVRAVHAVRPLREVAVASRTRQSAERLADQMRAELPRTRFRVVDTAAEAVRDMPIVNCATSAGVPVLDADDLHPRAHVNAVGSFRPAMRELPAALLARAEVLVVEQRDAALAEAGEVIHAVETGAVDAAAIRELGEVLTAPPTPTGRTVFKSVGVGIHDWTIARLLATRLDGHG